MKQFSKNTLKLLKFFYAHPGQQFYIQELGRIFKKKPGVFQRALYSLEQEGVLKSEYKANARFFCLNKDYSFYKEFKSIVLKLSRFVMMIIFFSFLCAGRNYAFCQENKTETLTLSSLKEAISVAIKNNKDIRIEERQVEVARADILGARSAFLPNLDFNASYTRRGAVPQQPAAGLKKDPGVFTGYQDDNELGLSLNQTIYNGGANLANLKQQQVALTEQEETLRATKLNVEQQVKTLYYGLLLAYETRRIAENLVAQAQSHYENVKKKFQQGTASKFDVLQSKVQVSVLIPQLINALTAIDLIMAELNKELGLNVQQRIVAQDKLGYAPTEVRESEFLKEAYLHKPEMILQSLGIDMSKWQIKYARAGWLPQITAGAGYDFRSNNTANIFNDQHSNWHAGVALSIPIFDGFATKAKVDAAKALYAQALLSKENVADQIAVDIRQACVDLKQAQALIDSQRDNLEDAREALRISEIRYDNGIGVNLDVLDAQVALAQVEQNLASGIYDYLIAQASLDRNMGVEYLKEAKHEKKN
jgi:outer membrane protein TolC